MQSDDHSTIILPVCHEIFKRLEGKVDILLNKTDKFTDKFIEINGLRAKVENHEEKFAQLDVHNRWLIGILSAIILAIVMQIGTFLYLWGSLNKQVEIDSGKITAIEEIHPRVAK